MIKKNLISILVSSFLIFPTSNLVFAKNIETSNVEQNIQNINNTQINWLDNYLESIILNSSIKKIDLQLNVLNFYKNDTNELNSLFSRKVNYIKNLNDYKLSLKNKLTVLKTDLMQNKKMQFNNDFDVKKLLNADNFNLKQDKSSIVAFIKNYQQILKNNQQKNKIIEQEIQQGKRSKFDIDFALINDLDNQIFLKKAVKIYFIEKLKQQPTMTSLKELNSYLIQPLNLTNPKLLSVEGI